MYCFSWFIFYISVTLIYKNLLYGFHASVVYMFSLQPLFEQPSVAYRDYSIFILQEIIKRELILCELLVNWSNKQSYIVGSIPPWYFPDEMTL